ncbi:hypothetical protein EBB56_12570 [Halomonas sp. YLB-10]|nr:hypothetical protein EBB56_12570 [Halomonas sp. YLB-10]
MRKRSLRGVNEHFDPIFNAVLPSAGTFQTSPRVLPATAKGAGIAAIRGLLNTEEPGMVVAGMGLHETLA